MINVRLIGVIVYFRANYFTLTCVSLNCLFLCHEWKSIVKSHFTNTLSIPIHSMFLMSCCFRLKIKNMLKIFCLAICFENLQCHFKWNGHHHCDLWISSVLTCWVLNYFYTRVVRQEVLWYGTVHLSALWADPNYTWGLAILADSLLFSVNNILAGLWLNVFPLLKLLSFFWLTYYCSIGLCFSVRV